MFRKWKIKQVRLIGLFIIILMLNFSGYMALIISNNNPDYQEHKLAPFNLENGLDLKLSSAIESTTVTIEYQYSSSFVVDMPSYRPDGDLYIAQIAFDDDNYIPSHPSGWTLIAIQDNGETGAVDVSLANYWKIGDSEPSTYTWTLGTSRKWIGAVYRISDFNSDDPIHAFNTNSGTGQYPTAPSVSTTIDNCLILRSIAADDDWSVTNFPSGSTPLFQDDAGYDSAMSAAAYHEQSTAGYTGTAQFRLSGSDVWVAMTIAINPLESTPPTYSNLVESADPLELGESEMIRINTTDPSGINQVLLEFSGTNHSMTYKSGDMWEYSSWTPTSLGTKSYTIWMEDNHNNWNSTSGSILVVDTTAPTYSDLIESADPLPFGQNETISIKVYDSPGSGVSQVLLEYDGTNHSMVDTGVNSWRWTNWKPSSIGVFPYRIYMNDTQNNWNSTAILNITVVVNTAPLIENVTAMPDPLELGDNITITVDALDNETSVSVVLIEFQNVNYTMNYIGINSYNYSWTRISVGIVVFTIHANDSENNWNRITSSFDIIDTTPPNYDNLTESSTLLELGETLVVTIDAVDLSGIQLAKIEFEGHNHSMSYLGGNTWQHDLWTPSSIGMHFYKIWIEDNQNNWNFSLSNITVQDTINPTYSNLIESDNPVELGDQLTISIEVYDLADINRVLLEFGNENHSMVNIGGNVWIYDSWMPTIIGNYSYTIYMEDNNNNYNRTDGSIVFVDTTSPSYSSVFENSDPLELGTNVIITVDIEDFAGINRALIEYEGANHSMINIYGDTWQYSSWVPTNWTNYPYIIHSEDNSGNRNFISGNITVQDTTPPSSPILTNSPSGEVSGILTFDWLDGSDPSGISYYVLIIDTESNPELTPGYFYSVNITNVGPQSSYYEIDTSLPAGKYYYFIMQVDGVGHQSSYTTGTFTVVVDLMIFIIIGLIIAAAIGSTLTYITVRRRMQNKHIPNRRAVPLKLILSHIQNILNSAPTTEQPDHKGSKSKEKVKSLKDEEDTDEVTTRISKVKEYAGNLFAEGAYLEAKKQYEFAENILLKLGKKEEASNLSNLALGIGKLVNERDDTLERLEKAKLDINSLTIFEKYNLVIELSNKLNDFDSAELYLSELTEYFKNNKTLLKDLEYHRFKLYKQANILIEEKKLEQSVTIYKKCLKITQFLVHLGRENEQNNVKNIKIKIKELLDKSANN